MVHNEYGKFSGEEAVVQQLSRLLLARGHQIIPFTRSSAEIPGQFLGTARAFFSGIYSLCSAKQMRSILRDDKPELVHVHNLFPLISPSILRQCRNARVPVVMTVHNYRLVCPNGLHMRNSAICEKCAGGREYWCALANCERSIFKSLGYALRTYIARKWRLYHDNVTIFAALTEFQRRRLIAAGFPPGRINVLPNMAKSVNHHGNNRIGDYVSYVGRLSPEKGIPLLLEAARRLPTLEFRAAGDYARMPEIARLAPSNFRLVGVLSREQLDNFHRRSRFLVLPTTCFEGSPASLAEAMAYSKPAICTRIGGLPEIVDHGETGFLVDPADLDDLSAKILHLWENPELCRRMGAAAREKALREYSPDRYYERLMDIYDRAMRHPCWPETSETDERWE